jgi:predicted nucleic acid-binding Zn ribbon protein
MVKLGELLNSVLAPGFVEQAQKYHSLFSSWASIAGPNLAAHSRIAELEHSVLLVEADHPGWVQMLQMQQGRLLARLQKRFPELNISGIAFKLSKAPVEGGS